MTEQVKYKIYGRNFLWLKTWVMRQAAFKSFSSFCEHINEHFTFHKIVEFFIDNGKAVCVRTVKEHVGVVV